MAARDAAAALGDETLIYLIGVAIDEAMEHCQSEESPTGPLGESAMITSLLLCAHLAVVDGDTLKCDGQLLRLLGEGTPFVSGIDTPELRTWKCQKERKLAHLARMRLKELLIGRPLKIVAKGHDNTTKHRPLVNVYLRDGREVGKILLKEGFARPWHPRQHIDWCS